MGVVKKARLLEFELGDGSEVVSAELNSQKLTGKYGHSHFLLIIKRINLRIIILGILILHINA